MQQRGWRDHQHIRGLGVIAWVEEQAKVAVRHLAGHEDLAVDVLAKLCH